MKRRRKAPSRVRENPPAYQIEPARQLLLDTQVWIWWHTGDARLAKRARLAIQSAQQVFVSVTSIWEAVIKHRLGKLDLPGTRDVASDLSAAGFTPLSVDLRHALGVLVLPKIHGDPFDRMLVSQAVAEGLTIVTADAAIARYPVPVLDARA